MWLSNYHGIIPELYLGTIIVFLLVFGVFYTKIGGKYNKFYKYNYLTILTLIWTFLIIFVSMPENTLLIGEVNRIEINSLNEGIKGILVLSTLGVLWITWNSYTQYKINKYEYTLLILLSLLGIFVLVSAKDLLLIYLGVELISLSLYVMASIRRSRAKATEAGLKYFILGALSSGVLLFGLAVIYNTLGTTNMLEIKNIGEMSTEVKIGGMMVIVSMLFKVAAAPLHMWAPDVYEGAPSVVTAYFAIVPKIGILYVLYELIFGVFWEIYDPMIRMLIMTTAILSIAIGTFGAINQNRIIRLLAYSAIVHIGYILLGFSTGTINGILASFVYIIIYIIMSINIFGLILSIYRGDEEKYIEDIRGLGKQRPVLAITLSLTLLSIAGIPPLAGFLSKFYVMLSLIEQGQIILAGVAITLSVIGSYYYLKIIKGMYFEESSLITAAGGTKIRKWQGILIGITTYMILTLLINPEPVVLLVIDIIVNSVV